MANVTVVIPVGPFEANKRWLKEALDSVAAQTLRPNEILLIDDMAGLDGGILIDGDGVPSDPDPGMCWIQVEKHNCHIWYAPWRLGVPHAFNFGVALAQNELVFLMGSDDTLEPRCLERCVAEWENNERKDAYYYTGIKYMDDGEEQTLACGYALVTKGLWRKTGGFPVESAVGAPDVAFVSILMVHHKGSLVKVADGAPLVNYRRHNDSDTAGRGPWQGAILAARGAMIDTWTKPQWPRC